MMIIRKKSSVIFSIIFNIFSTILNYIKYNWKLDIIYHSRSIYCSLEVNSIEIFFLILFIHNIYSDCQSRFLLVYINYLPSTYYSLPRILFSRECLYWIKLHIFFYSSNSYIEYESSNMTCLSNDKIP